MTLFGLHLDKPRAGTHYADRMQHILGCCHACGLWREDRYGAQVRRLPLVRAGEILAPDNAPVESYGLIVPPANLAKVLGMARQFASALNVPRVTVAQDGGVVWVRVPIERPGYLSYEDAWSLAPDLPEGHVLLGVNDEGAQVTLDLDGAPHCALFGMSGSGKSTLLRTMAFSATQRGATVALLDPSSDLAPLSGLSQVWQSGYFENEQQIETCLRYLAEQTLHNVQQGRLYVFVDEAPRLCRRTPLRDALVQLGNEGRRFGIHLVLGAQSQKELGTSLMANIGVSIVGKMRDAQHAAQAAGQSRTGAEKIADPGRFIVTKGERTVNLHAARMSPALLDKLAWEFHPRHGVLPITPEPDIAKPAESHQAPRVAVAQSVGPSVSGDPGRAPDELPASVRHAIIAHWRRYNRPPTRRWIAEQVGALDIDKGKHHRWLTESLGERWRR